MTWREQLVIRILLIIARMAADDPVIREDLKHLHNHIHVHKERVEDAS